MRRSDFIAGVKGRFMTERAATSGRFKAEWLRQPFGSQDKDDWFSEIVPREPQKLPSCVFQSTTQALMALIRREHGRKAIPKGYGLDGDWLYRAFCDRTRGGDYSDGAALDDGIKECAEQGLLGSQRWGIAAIPFNYDYFNRMLRVTPLLFGFALTPGWFQPGPHPKTGQIPIGGLPDPGAGHAVLGVDVQRFGADEYLVGANSWGVKRWGRHGYFVMTLRQAAQQALSKAVAFYLPDGTGTAWEKFLVKM